MKRFGLISAIIAVATLGTALYFFPRMPAMIASHWNAYGAVDGYIPRFWGMAFIPVLSFILLALSRALPALEPFKKNLAEFRVHFDRFIVLLLLFFYYVLILMIMWNLGAKFYLHRALIPALAVVIYYSGVVMGKSKRNWFIGIRTPWTLGNDIVWEKTHKLGGILFRLAAAVMLSCMLAKKLSVWLVVMPIVLAAFISMVYSYLEYTRITLSD